jgi:hypothetical protein
MSPEAARQIAGHAQDHVECRDCAAVPGQPCTSPGPGRSVHKSRYIAAAIQVKRALSAAAQTLEQQAILASLPAVNRAEIEKCRTPKGGYSFTRAWFLEHGLPYPPVPGWRQAVDREDGDE